MKRSLFTILVLILILPSCTLDKKGDIEVWKKEIADTEHAFAAMAKVDGVAKAFITFAANDAVLLRNNELIKGKDAIEASYDRRFSSGNASLTWAPDFVDVSSSGGLGYTYGKYVYTSTDSLGNSTTSEGIFHTVWKRQSDGTWKFVWD
ncbi:MAG: nuclear transport factor 2 family protein [Cyclobacteriaceae bacterium]